MAKNKIEKSSGRVRVVPLGIDSVSIFTAYSGQGLNIRKRNPDGTSGLEMDYGAALKLVKKYPRQLTIMADARLAGGANPPVVDTGSGVPQGNTGAEGDDSDLFA
jgi:hypothetical protein